MSTVPIENEPTVQPRVARGNDVNLNPKLLGTHNCFVVGVERERESEREREREEERERARKRESARERATEREG